MHVIMYTSLQTWLWRWLGILGRCRCRWHCTVPVAHVDRALCAGQDVMHRVAQLLDMRCITLLLEQIASHVLVETLLVHERVEAVAAQ